MLKKTIRIITKIGDGGMTTLADGSRIAKSSPRMKAIGNVDELNSLIGLLLSEDFSEDIKAELGVIQSELFDIGGILGGASQVFEEERVLRLEEQAGKYDANLLPLQGFILPGGTRAAAFVHLARSVCRRTERSVFALAEQEPIPEMVGKYLNRLSDLLFIHARAINREAGEPDRLWQKPKKE